MARQLDADRESAQINVPLPIDTHRRLRVLTSLRNMTQGEVIARLIDAEAERLDLDALMTADGDA